MTKLGLFSFERGAIEEVEMREMTGGCLCGQVRYSANADRLLSPCVTARTVRSRLGPLSLFLLAFQRQRFQFVAT